MEVFQREFVQTHYGCLLPALWYCMYDLWSNSDPLALGRRCAWHNTEHRCTLHHSAVWHCLIWHDMYGTTCYGTTWYGTTCMAPHAMARHGMARHVWHHMLWYDMYGTTCMARHALAWLAWNEMTQLAKVICLWYVCMSKTRLINAKNCEMSSSEGSILTWKSEWGRNRDLVRVQSEIRVTIWAWRLYRMTEKRGGYLRVRVIQSNMDEKSDWV